VIADDGQIVVLGGLIRDDTGDNNERVTGLGSLPIIGNLFKYRKRNRTKTNLMVFLRPVIVRSKDDSNAIAVDRYEFMRSSGARAAQPASFGVPDLGTPTLPALINGQPQQGEALVPMPPRTQAAPTQAPVKPAGTPSGKPADVSQEKYRPVQK
jgi:general secretion pathway protein D